MDLFVGTSGFSYKEWKGNFYPPDLPASEWLRYYAERLPSVEINNTFYRMPKKEVLASWAEQVPESFRFVVKAPRRITHIKRLKDVESEAGFLFENLSALGARLGAVLVQLPPNLPKDTVRLDAFLSAVPEGFSIAFEFRNPSWHSPDVLDRLRARDAALAAVDDDELPDPPFTPTASWGYLRLRRLDYGDDALRSWAERIAAASWERAFLFFKHEDEGIGPKLAARFLSAAIRG
ncbi:MAG TPA: DUF72 domain-containing protein [Thermoanaerobaculia bacterium]|jgi:uncharacterized protein YecE (DUF72 family)|nr:DUF72 domain-containing protein [Thermoanaerobaculia bacterium]